MRFAAEEAFVEAETSEVVEQVGNLWWFDFQGLLQIIAEKAKMFEAFLNYSNFKCLDVDLATPEMIRESSAGVYGWASAIIEEWHNPSVRDLMRSGMGLQLPLMMTGTGSRVKTRTIKTPDSNPLLHSIRKGNRR